MIVILLTSYFTKFIQISYKKVKPIIHNDALTHERLQKYLMKVYAFELVILNLSNFILKYKSEKCI